MSGPLAGWVPVLPPNWTPEEKGPAPRDWRPIGHCHCDWCDEVRAREAQVPTVVDQEYGFTPPLRDALDGIDRYRGRQVWDQRSAVQRHPFLVGLAAGAVIWWIAYAMWQAL